MNYTQYKTKQNNWHIYENFNAVQPYSFFSDDYDGEKMQGSNKQGTATSLELAKQKIDELEASK